MAVLSATDRKRFTPASYEGREDAPVYVMAPLGWRERGRFRAALADLGVRYPPDKELASTAVKLIEELDPDNKAELLGIVEAFGDLVALGPLLPVAEDASEEDRATHQVELDRRLSIAMPYDDVLDALRGSQRLGRLLGLRMLFNETAPALAASFALCGWENTALAFKRVDGVVPDSLLNQLPQADLVAIGLEALASMTVSAAQRGN